MKKIWVRCEMIEINYLFFFILFFFKVNNLINVLYICNVLNYVFVLNCVFVESFNIKIE